MITIEKEISTREAREHSVRGGSPTPRRLAALAAGLALAGVAMWASGDVTNASTEDVLDQDVPGLGAVVYPIARAGIAADDVEIPEALVARALLRREPFLQQGQRPNLCFRAERCSAGTRPHDQ